MAEIGRIETGAASANLVASSIYKLVDTLSPGSNIAWGNALYFPNSSETDQGATGNGKSAKAYIDKITSNNATLVFVHAKGQSTTTYTFSTSETIPSNIRIVIETGAILSIDNGVTLTINGPFKAELYQVFSGAGSVSFGPGAVREAHVHWWYDGGTYWATAIQAAIDTFDGVGGTVTMPTGELPIDTTILITENGLLLQGSGGIGNSHLGNVETNRSTTIVNKSGDEDAIVVGIADTYMSDVVFKDFALDGDSGTATAGNGIVLDSKNYPSGVKSFKLYNVSIHHVKETALYLLGNIFESSFFGLEIRFCDNGIYANNPYGGQCTQMSFYGAQVWACTNYGFKKGALTSNINFYGSNIGENDIGIQTCTAMLISGCFIENNTTTGIDVGAYSATIIGGHVAGSATGIDFSAQGGSNSTADGVVFASNTLDVDVSSGCRNVRLVNLHQNDGTQITLANADRTTQIVGSNYESITANGACQLWGITEFNTTGGAIAVTLADGTAIGQRKRFNLIIDNGDVTLTVAKHETASPEVFTFDDAGDYLVLEWSRIKWLTIKNFGVAV